MNRLMPIDVHLAPSVLDSKRVEHRVKETQRVTAVRHIAECVSAECVRHGGSNKTCWVVARDELDSRRGKGKARDAVADDAANRRAGDMMRRIHLRVSEAREQQKDRRQQTHRSGHSQRIMRVRLVLQRTRRFAHRRLQSVVSVKKLRDVAPSAVSYFEKVQVRPGSTIVIVFASIVVTLLRLPSLLRSVTEFPKRP